MSDRATRWWLGAACVLAWCAVARAEPTRADLQQLHPPATQTSFLGLDDPTPLSHLATEVGLAFSDGHDPLVLRDGAGELVPGGQVVVHQLWLEATASIGLGRRFELGAAVPIALYQGGDASGAYDPAAAYRGQRGAALGDLRFDGKMLLVSREFAGSTVAQPFALRLALIVGFTVPSGTDALAGDQNMTGRPRLVLGFYDRRLEVVASVGGVFRERVHLLNIDVTQQVTWGAGLRGVVWRELDLAIEGRGTLGVAPFNGRPIGASDISCELDASIGYRTPIGLRPYLGGGIGLGAGYGTPAGRFILGARYDIPEHRRELPWDARDDDHDGVRNELDRCPREPGPRANDGCPDLDLDHDGVIDRLDACPNRAGPPDNRGCPDVDSDGDTVPDRLDRCPHEPGPAFAAGCPLADRDHDGVPDSIDRCPDQPGVADNQGCPDVDSDGDGLVDRLDRCPFDVEIYNGVEDDDGCPDAGAALAGLAHGQVVLFEPIVFEKVGAQEQLSAKSMNVIDAVGGLLRAHVEIERVRIDGHTDDRGDRVDNLDLSLRRAQMVRKELTTRERIDPKRVTAEGFGSSHPLVTRGTPQGRARNRRIEITILPVAP